MQISTEIERKCSSAPARSEREYPCPRCGLNVVVLRRLKRGSHQMHLDGECKNGHRVWRHGSTSVNWFEDWKRVYQGCRCPVQSGRSKALVQEVRRAPKQLGN
jgi:transcription elongation factor Elf1